MARFEVALIIIVGLGAIVAAKQWLGKPLRHKGVRPSDLRRFFEVLLARGGPEGMMFIETGKAKSAKFLQFRRLGPPGFGRVRMDFPDAPWSRDLFGRVRQISEEAGFSNSLHIPEAGTLVRAFLLVELGRDEERLAHFAALVLVDGFGIPLEAPCLVVWFTGVAGP